MLSKGQETWFAVGILALGLLVFVAVARRVAANERRLRGPGRQASSSRQDEPSVISGPGNPAPFSQRCAELLAEALQVWTSELSERLGPVPFHDPNELLRHFPELNPFMAKVVHQRLVSFQLYVFSAVWFTRRHLPNENLPSCMLGLAGELCGERYSGDVLKDTAECVLILSLV